MATVAPGISIRTYRDREDFLNSLWEETGESSVSVIHPRLQPGQLLYGFCNGYLGRNPFHSKRIESVGDDWVVARDKHGKPHFASGENIHVILMKFTDPSYLQEREDDE